MVENELAGAELRRKLDAHHEWLMVRASGDSFALTAQEIELDFSRSSVLFGFPGDAGFQTWRIAEWNAEGEEIVVGLSRGFRREREKIRLIPRVSPEQFSGQIALARLAAAQKIAAAIRENHPKIKIARLELNKTHGRFVNIVIENIARRQTAVLADVCGELTPEFLLSTAILRLIKLRVRRKNPIDRLVIVGAPAQAKKLQKLRALLRGEWQSKIIIWEMQTESAPSGAAATAADRKTLRELDTPPLADVCGAARRTSAAGAPKFAGSRFADEIAAASNGEIDVVAVRRGVNLRYRGLVFARVRKVLETEHVWFGVDRASRRLTADNEDEFAALAGDLAEFRRRDAAHKRHAFYADAPEAWLESMLRANIKLLDANLILSPVHHQFRAGRDKIDLLALRKDGRLVIIELKTQPDREMIFQAADYWRKIEAQRRVGNLRDANLFGDAPIADAPTVIYLAAPTLSFHRDFDVLAQTISPEIEIHRFNLSEDWRETPKVLERIRIA